jgi:hypothetical protein
MMPDQLIQQIAQHCRETLPLRDAALAADYGYVSLPLCVIDAVFSLGVRYQSTRNVVDRFRTQFPSAASSDAPMPIRELLRIYGEYGVERMADEVFGNRQRTSPRCGILKADAVLQFATVLSTFGVQTRVDMPTIQSTDRTSAFESAIQAIPGQRNGISLRYFYMLAGSDDYVKPDRMLQRFVAEATGTTLNAQDLHDALLGAHSLLIAEYPQLTPRLLDALIWKYQRGR